METINQGSISATHRAEIQLGRGGRFTQRVYHWPRFTIFWRAISGYQMIGQTKMLLSLEDVASIFVKLMSDSSGELLEPDMHGHLFDTLPTAVFVLLSTGGLTQPEWSPCILTS